jgi:MoxR-like ATPase
MRRYALPHEDGTISIMQLIADHPVEHEIARSVFSSPVILEGVTEITEEQAAIIRAQRPKPTIPPNAAPVSQQATTDILLIQQKNADLEAEMAQLRRDVQQQLQEFPLRLAEMISRAKAEEPAQ